MLRSVPEVSLGTSCPGPTFPVTATDLVSAFITAYHVPVTPVGQ